MNVIVIVSTGGSVLSRVLEIEEIRETISLVVSDRDCQGLVAAKKHGIATRVFYSKSGSEFSEELVRHINFENVDVIVSFYTRLFTEPVLGVLNGRLINLHPSILPACPGQRGFEDMIEAKSRFIGATIHQVDKGMDTGAPIIQSCHPYNPNLSIDQNRHVVFLDQCRMLIQVLAWIRDKRIDLYGNDNPTVEQGSYNDSSYSPNLEDEIAIHFR